jgi:hypothetical protein
MGSLRTNIKQYMDVIQLKTTVILMIPAVRSIAKYHHCFLGNGRKQNFTNANYQRIRQRYRPHASYYLYSRTSG